MLGQTGQECEDVVEEEEKWAKWRAHLMAHRWGITLRLLRLHLLLFVPLLFDRLNDFLGYITEEDGDWGLARVELALDPDVDEAKPIENWGVYNSDGHWLLLTLQ